MSEASEGAPESQLPFHAPNVWPDEKKAPAFKPALLAYRDALVSVRDKCALSP